MYYNEGTSKKGGAFMSKITLTAARVNSGLTQEEIAEKMGVSRSTIIAWENGKKEMRPAYLYAYCHITGFSEDDILLPKKSTEK